MTDHQSKTSTGHDLGNQHRLELHFQAKQSEYEATLRAVGLQPGWCVLDAGCGAGHFLPLMSELVGSQGHVDALDLAPENVAHIEQMRERQTFACPVAVAKGNVLDLPYPDNTFDAVWVANVVQYLTDEELSCCLEECMRVTKSGGLVAVKEVDVTAMQIYPFDPTVMWHLLEAGRQHDTNVAGWFRGMQLPKWFRKAGLQDVRVEPTLYERANPLPPEVRAYVQHNLEYWAYLATRLPLSVEEQELWRKLGQSPAVLLDDSDFFYRTMHVLAVGIVSQSSC